MSDDPARLVGGAVFPAGGAVLVVAADASARRALRRALAEAGWLVVTLGDARAVADVMRGVQFDALVLHGEGEATRCARSLAHHTPTMILDGSEALDGSPERLAACVRERDSLN